MKWHVLLASFLAVACTATAPSNNPAPADKKITVFYNNDNFGYIEPCGCRITPIGGMQRRWNGMLRIPDTERIFVDAGNSLFKTKLAPDYLAPQWYEQAAGVIEAYNLLKLDAIEPGETDFALGLEKFLTLKEKAKFPFISANIFEKQSGKLLLPAHAIIERNGWKIGIFGVFNQALSLPPELIAKDPVIAAQEQVKELRAQGVNLILALSHQGLEKDQELAQKVQGVHLIVGAYSQSLLQRPERVGETDIVQLSSQGQMLGKMEYGFDAKGAPKLSNATVEELNNEFDRSPFPDLPNPMKSLSEITNIRIAEVNKKQSEQLWEAHKADSPAGYQTFLNCRSCHTSQAKFQEGTLHAAAMLTLAIHKQENNLDCVKCHSVGLGQAGGFSSLGNAILTKEGASIKFSQSLKAAGLEALSGSTQNYRKNPAQIRPDVAHWIDGLKKIKADKAFVSVQCENCHGPLPDHPFGSTNSPGKVLTTRCLECHTKEQMPAWYDSQGKINPASLNAAVKKMGCPR